MNLVNDEDIITLLKESKTIAVVGLSPKTNRASFRIASYMQQAGYRIIPVRPGGVVILGEQSYPSLKDIPKDIQVDLVDVFRGSENTPPIATNAVAVKAKGFWLQSGIINQTAMDIAKLGGLIGVQDRCLAVEHRRLADKL
ncbi:MAG: CoA-binding protein [Magnetococcales bacterium]|nr:CoA-binding protein [Magnetococcales bacterium]